MAKKEVKEVKEEIKPSDVGLPEEAKKGVPVKGKEKKMAPINEMVFRVGDKIALKDLPFKVKEVRGLDVVLCRTDIR